MKAKHFEPCLTRRGAGLRVPQRPFFIVRTQTFLPGCSWSDRVLSAFRERAHWYAETKTLAYVALESAQENKARSEVRLVP